MPEAVDTLQQYLGEGLGLTQDGRLVRNADPAQGGGVYDYESGKFYAPGQTPVEPMLQETGKRKLEVRPRKTWKTWFSFNMWRNWYSETGYNWQNSEIRAMCEYNGAYYVVARNGGLNGIYRYDPTTADYTQTFTQISTKRGEYPAVVVWNNLLWFGGQYDFDGINTYNGTAIATPFPTETGRITLNAEDPATLWGTRRGATTNSVFKITGSGPYTLTNCADLPPYHHTAADIAIENPGGEEYDEAPQYFYCNVVKFDGKFWTGCAYTAGHYRLILYSTTDGTSWTQEYKYQVYWSVIDAAYGTIPIYLYVHNDELWVTSFHYWTSNDKKGAMWRWIAGESEPTPLFKFGTWYYYDWQPWMVTYPEGAYFPGCEQGSSTSYPQYLYSIRAGATAPQTALTLETTEYPGMPYEYKIKHKPHCYGTFRGIRYVGAGTAIFAETEHAPPL